MERTHPRGRPAALPEPAPLLAAYDAGVAAIFQLAGRFDLTSWNAQRRCPEWRAFELAAHVRCVADDLHEYLDEAPMSRYARLMAMGAHPDSLARKLARQNAAELAAMPDAPPGEHVAAFVASARRYAARLGGVWELPHHQYRDAVVTVGGMAGAACAEWHLHASDLAAALGIAYRPPDPDAVLAGWLAGMPHLPLPPPHGRHAAWHGRHAAWHGRLAAWHGRHADPWHTVLAASGRAGSGSVRPLGLRSPIRRTGRPLLRRKG